MSSFKRALQYASLSALGVSSRLFKGRPLSLALNRAMARKMTGMKGLPLKINQILGMSDRDSSELNRQALEEIEPMSMVEVKAIIAEVCPDLLRDSTISHHFSCASLGQVCRLSKSGIDYAVKVQYPELDKNMKMDNKAVGLMTNCFRNFSRGFDMSDYDKVLKEELALELDYWREIDMQHEFYRIFSDDRDIIIPLSMKKYSGSHCLVMSWEPSLSLDEFIQVATEEQRKSANRLIVNFYVTSIFKYGLLHSDPNPGNFGFRIFGDKVQLVVYDYGSVVKMSQQQHLSLLSLFDLCIKRKNPLPALTSLGFKRDLLAPLAKNIPALMQVLLQPLLAEGYFSYSSWNRQERVNDILGDKRWNFMVAAPADLFFFMRAVHGLIFYTGKLTGGIFSRKQIDRCIQVHRNKLAHLLKNYSSESLHEDKLSNYLVISVKEAGVQKVKLTFPAASIENLPSFIPPDVESKLKDKKISIANLVSQVRQNGYKPQAVFSFNDGHKDVSVYLE